MNSSLKILLAASVFFAISGGLFGPLYAIYVEDIGGSLLETGISWSIFMIISGVGIIVVGKVTDIVERDELILILGFSLSTFGSLGYLFISNKYELFILQVLFGIAHAITAPAYDTIYSKGLEKGKFAFQWSICESVFMIFGGIGALIGGFIVSLFGFRILFISMFIFGIIGLIVSALLLSNNE